MKTNSDKRKFHVFMIIVKLAIIFNFTVTIFFVIICRLCSVDISSDQGMISAGFEDSSIKIWRVSPGSLQTKETDTDPSKLFLAADYWNVESEERLDITNKSIYSSKYCYFRFVVCSQYFVLIN